MQEDQPVRERRQRKPPVRRDEQDGRRDRGRDLEEPGVAVLRADARKDQQPGADGEKDRRLAPGRNGGAQLSQSVMTRTDFVAFQSAALILSGTVHAKSLYPPPIMHFLDSIAS